LGLFPGIDGHEYGIGIGRRMGLVAGHPPSPRKRPNSSPASAGRRRSVNGPLGSRLAEGRRRVPGPHGGAGCSFSDKELAIPP
jgi:hypothetical protein